MGLRAILNLPRGINVLLLYHLSSSREEIHQDLRKRGVTKPNGWQFYLAMLSKGPHRNVLYYRTHQSRPLLTKISKFFFRPQDQLAIDAQRIGGGMSVYHGNASIVFAKEIGKNFTVYQQVTVGRGKCIDGNDCPIIGDNVTIYAGAIVVGGIRIGNGASIGAGAVVVKDVPDNAVVVGAPVRIIQK